MYVADTFEHNGVSRDAFLAVHIVLALSIGYVEVGAAQLVVYTLLTLDSVNREHGHRHGASVMLRKFPWIWKCDMNADGDEVENWL